MRAADRVWVLSRGARRALIPDGVSASEGAPLHGPTRGVLEGLQWTAQHSRGTEVPVRQPNKRLELTKSTHANDLSVAFAAQSRCWTDRFCAGFQAAQGCVRSRVAGAESRCGGSALTLDRSGHPRSASWRFARVLMLQRQRHSVPLERSGSRRRGNRLRGLSNKQQGFRSRRHGGEARLRDVGCGRPELDSAAGTATWVDRTVTWSRASARGGRRRAA
jgi:hypothetical protein